MSEPIPADRVALLRDLVARLQRGTLSRLTRIPIDALYWQAHRETNSIGVTMWHYTRWFDLLGTVTLVGGETESQHWFRDGWMERTGYDPRGIGSGGLGLITGYTVDEMLAVPRLPASELAEYLRASMASALVALRAVSSALALGPVRAADRHPA